VEAVNLPVHDVGHMNRAFAAELPLASQLKSSLERIDYLDCYTAETKLAERELVEAYAIAFGQLPTPFKHLLVIRSFLVRPFGIATVSYEDLARPIDTYRSYAIGDKIGRWTLFAKSDEEMIVGANDRHLDFRVSLFREAGARLSISTVVMTHNAFGRAYLALILPFHSFGVKKLLSDAATIAG
jgi:hypothetical protein